ncbi:MAG: LysM peptidoglycan-binding domain-containing protein [Ilumatobacter sp.]|uniref:LysM peptidoglycan-binding domain-containing protein n=1 Tax=Ilumatobacter sp. TaxID=1967498 RepID=UPI00261EBE5D|nr:LysM peptidoglycan-binding domain-containing protein [Ilumatobacter sp.]MDJ0769654.1 LysM peptidoglycan-binding domain-containing protein [Ilumatobacter sp.]
MRRLVLLPVLATWAVVMVACGTSGGGSAETLPPIRTTTTLAVTTTTVDPRDRIYIVQQGDNLSEIARSYQVTVAMIVELNRLTGETIQPGQELRIPNIRIDLTLPTIPETSTTEPP